MEQELLSFVKEFGILDYTFVFIALSIQFLLIYFIRVF